MSAPSRPLFDADMTNRIRLGYPVTQWKVPGQVLLEPATYTRLVASLVVLQDCTVVLPYSGSSEEEWRRWKTATKDHYEETASGPQEARHLITHLALGDSRAETHPPAGVTLDQIFEHCESRLRQGLPGAKGPFTPLDNNTLQQVLVFPMRPDPVMILKDKCEQMSREMGTGQTHYGGHEMVKSERILSHFLDPAATQNLVGPYPPNVGGPPLTPMETVWQYATALPAFMQLPTSDTFGTVMVWKTYDQGKVLQMSLQLDIPLLTRQFAYCRFVIYRHAGLKWHLDTPYLQNGRQPNPMLPLDMHMELLTHHMAKTQVRPDDKLTMASQAYRTAIRKQYKLVAAFTKQTKGTAINISQEKAAEYVRLERENEQMKQASRTRDARVNELQRELCDLMTKFIKGRTQLQRNEAAMSDLTKAFNNEYTKRMDISTRLADTLTKLAASQSEAIGLQEQLRTKEKEFQEMAELLKQQPSHQNMPPQVQHSSQLQAKRKREPSPEYTRVTITKLHPLSGNNDPPLPTKRVKPNRRVLSPISHIPEPDINTSIDTQAPTEPATSPIRLPSSSPRRPRRPSTNSNSSILTWPTLPDVRGEDYQDDIPSLNQTYSSIPSSP